MKLLTIGVYGWNRDGFFAALRRANVDVFCDLRARRGLRGPEYAFANAGRLEARLAELGIRYVHCKELGAPDALRYREQAEDARAGVRRRDREALSPEFVEGYKQARLAEFDSKKFAEALGPEARTICLFCVERVPEACHRSLVAERLGRDWGTKPRHLLP